MSPAIAASPGLRRRAAMAAALLTALALHLAWLIALTTESLATPGPSAGGHSISVRLMRRPGQATDPPGRAIEAPSRATRTAEPGAERSTHAPARVVRMPSAEPARAAHELVYVDARRLTQRPTPIDEVVIRAPESSASAGSFRATLILYIGDDGTVMKIDVEESTLPPDLEDSARAAFAAARFRPGRIGEQVVGSKLRVEVGFDTEQAVR